MFITLPLLAGLAFSLDGYLRNAAIGNRQQQTTAVVTAYEPFNHNQCRYTFEVDGKQFSGMSSSPTRSATVGERMRVYFDPTDPRMNALEDFTSTSRRERGFAWIMVFGICGVALLILYTKWANRDV